MQPFSGASIVQGAMLNDAYIMSVDAATEVAEEERALVLAAQTDRDAAGRLFDKYYQEIFRYVYHSTLDHAVAEDLTSNVFFSAFRHLGLFRWRRIPFRAWLYRIASNEVRMHYRRQKRLLAVHAGPVDTEYPGAEPTAETAAAAHDDYRLLHRRLGELGQKYRTVIVLRYFEGKSLSEICEITNQREGTIKSQLHRGLAQLKEALMRAGVSLT
jgi:RNA polymerase sigma-70 factor (ECF subfamily)